MSRDGSIAYEEDEFMEEMPSPKRASKRKEKKMKKSQSQMAIVLTKSVPFLLKMVELIEKGVTKAMPLVDKGYELWDEVYKQLEPYGPQEIIEALTGFFMMFFGGFFISTVSVYEALNQGGRENLVKNLKKLSEQASNVREANAEDDELDEDGDGIADVNQISQGELATRKMMLFLRSCDPNVVSEALGNVYSIFLAVAATLQVKFARAVSLGVTIGNVLSKTTNKFIVPLAKEVVPDEMVPWVPHVANYIARLIGVSIALSINRVLSTVTTAAKGARLLIDAVTTWTQKRGLGYLTDGYIDDALAWVLCAAGIWGQLFLWHRLPVLIKLLLFPFTFTESILSLFVSVAVSKGTTTAGQQSAFGGAQGGAAAAAPKV